MQSSSILSTINKIRDESQRTFNHTSSEVSVLHNHQTYCDDVLRKICIEAELHADCLDQGSSLTDISYQMVSCEGVIPGDMAVQIIDKRLGGPGHSFNVIPVNAKLDLSTWKDNEEVIYNHLKGNNTARMLFAFEHDDESEDEFCRPTKIYYYFELYDESNQLVGKVMEGVIDNPIPGNGHEGGPHESLKPIGIAVETNVRRRRANLCSIPTARGLIVDMYTTDDPDLQKMHGSILGLLIKSLMWDMKN